SARGLSTCFPTLHTSKWWRASHARRNRRTNASGGWKAPKGAGPNQLEPGPAIGGEAAGQGDHLAVAKLGDSVSGRGGTHVELVVDRDRSILVGGQIAQARLQIFERKGERVVEVAEVAVPQARLAHVDHECVRMLLQIVMKVGRHEI